MLGTIARVLAGFVLACLVAGLVQVAFVVTPKDLASLSGAELSERLSFAGLQVLFAATLIGMFSAPFVLIASAIGEWQGVRSPSYYVLVGIAIALGGFAAQYAGEAAGQPTIVNNYALKAFLTTGFLGGFAYWLFAGRSAGTGEEKPARLEPVEGVRRPVAETAQRPRPRPPMPEPKKA